MSYLWTDGPTTTAGGGTWGWVTLHPKGAAALQALLPSCRVNLMAGIGHVPMMEVPAVTAADYLRFRAELQTSP